jgi:NAD(P)-dependent dehydrogenase (short-subunit alcohol dehydrogenase family)
MEGFYLNVENRVVLVTGSGSGIGEGIVKRFAENGAKVIVNDLDQSKIDRVVSDIQEEEGEATGVIADITRKNEVDDLFKNVHDKYGRIDILVNNAGIGRDKSIRKMTEEDWDTVLNVNLKGVFLCSKAAADYMIEQKYGRMINISSRAWLGWYGQTNYAASKGGVVSLTRTLAIELGKHNITANCIAPGLIETPLLMGAPQETRDRLMKAQPTGKIGSPDDIARAVLFFGANEARYITGQVMYVCGGKSIFATPDVG